MKLRTVVLACAAILFAFPSVAATAADEQREPKPRFKGVEVYSWKDDKGVWRFAIMNGTNREKTEKEVKEAATVYAGVDKFTAALKLLAVGEMVFWNFRVKGFEFPPKDDLKKIDEAAKAAKIELYRDDK